MRIIVMSDSHMYYPAIQEIMKLQPDADLYIHLGDGENECRNLKNDYPDKNFCFFKGNCDKDSSLNDFLVIPLDYGHRIFAAHGHQYDVKYTTSKMFLNAKINQCDIALFGNTHMRYCGYEEGIHIMNPGSCIIPRDGQPPSFGIIETTESGIMKNIVSLR